ncbi:MAG TPA: nucleotidyltransferase domain-containing protein [Epsilonproteobacteria bacterium]|nr:nucleotidyltransferase domain-containing protein [Campylobacterota bacterium]
MRRMTQNILQNLQKIKTKYEKEGVYIVGVFGSYAQDKFDDFSDIDIAYTIDHDRFSRIYSDGFSKILRIEEIRHALEKRFHKKVDFVSLDSNNKSFVDYIKKEMLYV